MHFYHSADPNTNASMHTQPQRSPLMNHRPQNPLYNPMGDHQYSYFNYPAAKLNTISHEDQYFYGYAHAPISYPNTDCTMPSEVQQFGTLGLSPTHQAIFHNRQKFRANMSYQMDSNTTSLGSLPELPSLEPYRDAIKGQSQNLSVDEFICPQEEAQVNNIAKAKGETTINHAHSIIEERSCESDSHGTRKSSTEDSQGPARPYRPDMKGWCEEDEKLLRKLAVQYKFDWKKVSKKFANKKYTPHFLKMRYKGHDEGPVPKRVKFSHEEDVLIAKCFEEYGIDWDKMVVHFTNRTGIMLKNRYYSYIRKNDRLDKLLEEAQKVEVPTTAIPNGDSEKLELEEASEVGQKELAGNMDVKLNIHEGDDGQKADEVAMLRAQLKSMKSLYLLTYKELSKYKKSE